ncbi:hypothetical protein F5Y14DRAFT_424499 [Nemania sp. NC0429]|nr:hypothetical protein F5Y14DRAFT_424499 [Nemania sp. NC0429]
MMTLNEAWNTAYFMACATAYFMACGTAWARAWNKAWNMAQKMAQREAEEKAQKKAQKTEDSAGEVFWETIVPRHKDSLVELAVHPVSDGSWCYGDSASKAILQCTKLKKLALFANEDHTYRQPTLPDKIIADLERLPTRLTELRLDTVWPTYQRDVDFDHVNTGCERNRNPKGQLVNHTAKDRSKLVWWWVEHGFCKMDNIDEKTTKWPRRIFLSDYAVLHLSMRQPEVPKVHDRFGYRMLTDNEHLP